jgi:hypothetical protein
LRTRTLTLILCGTLALTIGTYFVTDAVLVRSFETIAAELTPGAIGSGMRTMQAIVGILLAGFVLVTFLLVGVLNRTWRVSEHSHVKRAGVNTKENPKRY